MGLEYPDCWGELRRQRTWRVVQSVGIIANPAAGKDVRRLVSEARTVTATEKVALLRRMLAGLSATPVRDILYMPDASALVERAADGLPGIQGMRLLPLSIVRRNTAEDSLEAARLLAKAGVGAALTLGGDGTNRGVAKVISDVPLLPLSTGTNNAFPQLVEATTAGVALGLVAAGVADSAVQRRKRVEVLVDGALRDIALVDVAVLRHDPFGAQAVWRPEDVESLVLAQASAAAVGWSAVLGVLDPLGPLEPWGAHVRLDDGARTRVISPIAPGLVADVGILFAIRIALGEALPLQEGPHWLALDGEPLVHTVAGQHVELMVTAAGPRVIDVGLALELGARAGALRRGPWTTPPVGR